MKLIFIKSLASALLLLSIQVGAQTSNNNESFQVGKNTLTVGIASWINGYTPVYYERYLTNFMSIQAGVGVTYRSYMNDLGAEIWGDGGNRHLHDIVDNYDSYQYRKTEPGVYMSVAPRFYPRHVGMSGFYFAPMLEYKTYNYKAQKADVNAVATEPLVGVTIDNNVPRTSDYQPEYMHCVDFTSNIGGHYQPGAHVSIDWNVGFGLRKLSAQRLDLSFDNNGGAYVNNVRKYNEIRPLLTMNICVGGWF